MIKSWSRKYIFLKFYAYNYFFLFAPLIVIQFQFLNYELIHKKNEKIEKLNAKPNQTKLQIKGN